MKDLKTKKDKLKKQLIEKLTQFDQIEWVQNYFELSVNSISRAQALTGQVSLKEIKETTYGKRYSTTLNNYKIELLLHTDPHKDYNVFIYNGKSLFPPTLESKYSYSLIEFNKQEAKYLCCTVEKQVTTYLAEKEKQDKKIKEQKERLRQERKELDVLENLLK